MAQEIPTTGIELPVGSPAASELREWIAGLVGTEPSEVDLRSTLYAKAWGSTILCHAGETPLVLKIANPVVFPEVAAVYRLLGDIAPDRTVRFYGSVSFGPAECSLFEYLAGQTAEELPLRTGLLPTVEILGTVQRMVAKTGMDSLPGYSIAAIPTTLAADVDEQSPEVRTGLSDRLAALEELARQVEDRCFRSLDHPDVNPTNVILTADQSWHIIDWEEAMVGCPLFSLDRVLDEVPADDEGLRREVEDAYLGALDDGDRATLHMAAVLVPLRRAIEARQFARAIGRPDPHTRFTARMIAAALGRLDSLSS